MAVVQHYFSTSVVRNEVIFKRRNRFIKQQLVSLAYGFVCWHSTHKGWDLGLGCPLLSGDPPIAGRGRDSACVCPGFSETASYKQGKREFGAQIFLLIPFQFRPFKLFHSSFFVFS